MLNMYTMQARCSHTRQQHSTASFTTAEATKCETEEFAHSMSKIFNNLDLRLLRMPLHRRVHSPTLAVAVARNLVPQQAPAVRRFALHEPSTTVDAGDSKPPPAPRWAHCSRGLCHSDRNANTRPDICPASNAVQQRLDEKLDTFARSYRL